MNSNSRKYKRVSKLKNKIKPAILDIQQEDITYANNIKEIVIDKTQSSTRLKKKIVEVVLNDKLKKENSRIYCPTFAFNKSLKTVNKERTKKNKIKLTSKIDCIRVCPVNDFWLEDVRYTHEKPSTKRNIYLGNTISISIAPPNHFIMLVFEEESQRNVRITYDFNNHVIVKQEYVD